MLTNLRTVMMPVLREIYMQAGLIFTITDSPQYETNGPVSGHVNML
jgi:hypothetical protein